MEQNAIKLTCSYVPETNQNSNINKPKNDLSISEYNDPDYMPPQDMDYVPENLDEIATNIEHPENLNEEILEENYIMGKPSKAKTKEVKIKDISANDGRVSIQGRVINCECRETKSGKGMLIIDLYDGTGTMTCKSFAKDANEGNELKEKINQAKGIKIIGKSGLDTYANDITVIGNTIISIEDNIPELPKEEDEEDTPLILGKNMNITAPLEKVKDLTADDGTGLS